MAESVGRKFLIKEGSDVLAVGIRTKNVTINREGIDVTSDDDDGWRKHLATPGQQSLDLSIDGILNSDQLREDALDPTTPLKSLTLEYEDGGVISADFFLGNYSEGHPYNDAATFDLTLSSSGEVTYTAGS